MVKDKLRTDIKFDVDIEFSLDDGVTWTALLAGVTESIEQDLIVAGFVKIRSVNAVTNLTDISNTFFKGRVLDFVNIRQGKSITSLNLIFDAVQGDEIRISNLPICTNLDYTFRNVDLGTLTLKNIPEVTTALYMAYLSKIGIISSIDFPKITNAVRMYSGAKIDVIGDIKLSNPAISLCDTAYAFSTTSTNGMPTINVKSSTFRSDYTFSYCYAKYALYSNIGTFSSAASGVFQYSSMKINGIDYTMGANDSTSFVGTSFLSPGSRITKPNTKYFSVANLAYLNASISQEVKDRLSSTIYPAVINFDWLPQHKLLYSASIGYTDITSVNSKQMARLGSQFVFVDSNDNLQVMDKHRSFYRTSEYSVDKLSRQFLSKDSYFGKNNYYATYNGTDIILYNEIGTPVLTVTEPNVTFIDISSDASRLTYVTTTTDVNILSSTDDTVTQSIKVINGTNGQLIQSNDYVHVNERIESVYNPNADSVIAITINRFTPNIPLVIKDRGLPYVEFYNTLNTTLIGSEEIAHFVDFSFGSSGDDVELHLVEKDTGKTSLVFVGSTI